MPCTSMIQFLVPPPTYPSQAHLNLCNLHDHSETKFRVGDGFRLLLDGNLVPMFLAFPFSLLLSNCLSAVQRSGQLLQNLNVVHTGRTYIVWCMSLLFNHRIIRLSYLRRLSFKSRSYNSKAFNI